jgi:ABC-2 type transport system permease protein
MKKTFYVAARDFIATVSTRGFIIAVLLPPTFYGLIIMGFPKLMNNRVPHVSGTVSVIDPTGEVGPGIRRYLDPAAIAERRSRTLDRAMASTPFAGAARGGRAGSPAVEQAALGEAPSFQVVDRPEGMLQHEKDLLKAPRRGGDNQLAVVVIHQNAVKPADPGANGFGTYELYVRSNLDDRVQNEIRAAAADAIVDARVKAAGLDRARVDALTDVPRVRSVTVTDSGESATITSFNGLLPMGFAVLLMISVMSSGQYLLTTTIEEKSSRTIEVILSAVSPLQLLAGKILAQMAVGLVILTLYSSMGLLGLFSMAMLGLLDMSLLIYLLIFFLITYFVMGSLMAAIGSSVNELREAQSLMTPVTLLMMIPWLFWLPITRDPNSVFATVVSFIPPMNGFAMLLRLTSTAPPPMWQVWLSIAVGVAAAGAALWFASRVFKIGLLMHGRPPNFATLIRWAREA